MRQRRPAGERKTTCSKCGEDLAGSSGRYCRKCKADYMKGVRGKEKVRFEKMKGALEEIIRRLTGLGDTVTEDIIRISKKGLSDYFL